MFLKCLNLVCLFEANLGLFVFACIPAWSDEIRDGAKGGRMSKWYPGMDRHRAPASDIANPVES